MHDFEILIPSRGRAKPNLQYTIAQLSQQMRDRTKLVVRHDEATLYAPMAQSLGVGLLVRPESCINLSFTLDWLIHEYAKTRYIVLCDDDIRFSFRQDQTRSNQGKASLDEVDQIFERIGDLLVKGYPMVGLTARQGCNSQFPQIVKYGQRQMQLHAIDTEYFREKQIRPRDVTVKSDFHMTLSVLGSGAFNAVITNASVDQAKGSNAAGGVSSYRDLDTINKGAARLKELHPAFVNIVKKTTEWKGLGNVERDEVRIDWQRAKAKSKHPNLAA